MSCLYFMRKVQTGTKLFVLLPVFAAVNTRIKNRIIRTKLLRYFVINSNIYKQVYLEFKMNNNGFIILFWKEMCKRNKTKKKGKNTFRPSIFCVCWVGFSAEMPRPPCPQDPPPENPGFLGCLCKPLVSRISSFQSWH